MSLDFGKKGHPDSHLAASGFIDLLMGEMDLEDYWQECDAETLPHILGLPSQDAV